MSSPSNLVRLPTDVLACIADALDDGGRPFKATQSALSLTCKTMLPLCRRHIFSDLFCMGREDRIGTPRMRNLLSSNPSIAAYVKHFTYLITFSPWDDYENEETILQVLLENSVRLEYISIGALDQVNWNRVPQRITTLLTALMYLPSLTDMSLQYIDNFPLASLAPAGPVEISFMEMGPVTLPTGAHLIEQNKVFAPTALQIHGNQRAIISALLYGTTCSPAPAIDFRALQSVNLGIDAVDDLDLARSVVNATPHLRRLRLRMSHPYSLSTLSMALANHARHSLETIKFTMLVSERDPEPLGGLGSALRQLAADSVLANLKITVSFIDRPPPRIDFSGRDWTDLDTVLTEPGAFPLMRLVKLKLCWRFDHFGVVDPKERFPRLSNTNLFDFAFVQCRK